MDKKYYYAGPGKIFCPLCQKIFPSEREEYGKYWAFCPGCYKAVNIDGSGIGIEELSEGWVAYRFEHLGRQIGYPIPSEAREWFLEEEWTEVRRVPQNGPAFFLVLMAPKAEFMDRVAEIDATLREIDDIVAAATISNHTRTLESLGGEHGVALYELGDSRRYNNPPFAVPWHLVAKWRTGGGGHISLLYAKPSCSIEKLAEHLRNTRFSSGDSVRTQGGVLIISTKKMGAWIGKGGWRIKGLQAVTRGRVKLVEA